MNQRRALVAAMLASSLAAAFMKADAERWKNVAKFANIQLD